MNILARPNLVASLLTALAMLVIFATVSLATTSGDDAGEAAKNKKPVFSAKQKREVKKMIAAALKNKTGPAGPAGTPGTAVAPAAFTASNGSLLTLTTTYQEAASKALAPGKYVVNASVNGSFAGGSESAFLDCRALVDSVQVAIAGTPATANAFFDAVTGGFYLSVPLTFIVNSTSPSAVRIECRAWDSSTPFNVAIAAGGARFNAVQVGSIN